jgi:hypothetical protein
MEEITRLQSEYFVHPKKKILAYENTNAGGISDNCRVEFKYTFFVNFFFSQLPDRFWRSPSLLIKWYEGDFPQRQSGRAVKLTTYLHPVPKLYVCSPRVFVVCTGATLPLPKLTD